MVKQGKVINVDSAFIFLMIGLVWSGKLTRMIWIQDMKGLMGSLKIHLWMAYLAIMPLFIYSRIVRCHACPQAPVERRAIICLERICKKRQKRTKVYSRDAKKKHFVWTSSISVATVLIKFWGRANSCCQTNLCLSLPSLSSHKSKSLNLI